MSRIPRVTARQVLAALRKAGFALDHVAGSHHIPIGPARQRVTVPLHGGTLEVGLLHSILRQAGLTVEEFLALL